MTNKHTGTPTLDDFAGPFRTHYEAYDAARSIWGGGQQNLLLLRDKRFYINDGVNPEAPGDVRTLWREIPPGAQWVDVPEEEADEDAEDKAATAAAVRAENLRDIENLYGVDDGIWQEMLLDIMGRYLLKVLPDEAIAELAEMQRAYFARAEGTDRD